MTVTSGPGLPRCCDSHDDWRTLGAHLRREFAELDADVVARELGAAQAAALRVGLAPRDALDMSEVIARHQLMLLTGRRVETARLDPESHSLRRGT